MFDITIKSNKVKALLLSATLLTMTSVASADQCPMGYINYANEKAPDIMKKIKHEGKVKSSVISCFYDPNKKAARVSMQLDWLRVGSTNKPMWVQGNLDVNAQGYTWTTTMKSKRVEKWDSLFDLLGIKL